MRKPLIIVTVLVFTASALVASRPQAPAQNDVHAFLRKNLSFTTAELTSLDNGKVVARLPKTPEAREVGAFTVARLDVPPDFFIAQVRDIINFKKGKHVQQIGKFSNPPRLEDLADLKLDQVDIDGLKQCRVKSCDIKMSARFIERFRQDVTWSAPKAGEQAADLVREMLFDQVQSYLGSGNAALGKYDDKSYVVTLAAELQPLLKPAPFTYPYPAEFQRYVEEFPKGRPGDSATVEDFFYWSKEVFGLKPVISLTHVTIYRQSSDSASPVFMSSKGIYASHYLESSVGMTAFIPGRSGDSLKSYLIYVNRSRTDALRGLFGSWKRALAGGRVRDGARENMEVIKERLETDYRSVRGQTGNN